MEEMENEIAELKRKLVETGKVQLPASALVPAIHSSSSSGREDADAGNDNNEAAYATLALGYPARLVAGELPERRREGRAATRSKAATEAESTAATAAAEEKEEEE
jgi:hypothetical protein